MQPNNFIFFFTVQGFMLGIVFGLLNTKTPEGLLFLAITITVVFYLFAHVSVAMYIKFVAAREQYFPKSDYEIVLDKYANEVAKRESIVNSAYDFIEALQKEHKELFEPEKNAKR